MLSSVLGVLPILTPPCVLSLYYVIKVQSPCCHQQLLTQGGGATDSL
jgi:hypothetical protein